MSSRTEKTTISYLTLLRLHWEKLYRTCRSCKKKNVAFIYSCWRSIPLRLWRRCFQTLADMLCLLVVSQYLLDFWLSAQILSNLKYDLLKNMMVNRAFCILVLLEKHCCTVSRRSQNLVSWGNMRWIERMKNIGRNGSLFQGMRV